MQSIGSHPGQVGLLLEDLVELSRVEGRVWRVYGEYDVEVDDN